MKRNLEIYLGNHLSGAAVAVEILHGLIQKHRGSSGAAVFEQLLGEILDDRETLTRFMAETGLKRSRWKERVARWSARFARRKIANGDGLAEFEALETLLLGIRGKEALWRALQEVVKPRGTGDRTPGFPELIERAKKQRAAVEVWRLTAARSTLR